MDKWKIFVNVALPVAQNVNTDVPASGNVGQLVAPALWSMQVGYEF